MMLYAKQPSSVLQLARVSAGIGCWLSLAHLYLIYSLFAFWPLFHNFPHTAHRTLAAAVKHRVQEEKQQQQQNEHEAGAENSDPEVEQGYRNTYTE